MTEASDKSKRNVRVRRILCALLLLLAVLIAFGQAAGFQYIDLDDEIFVSANPQLQKGLSWEGIRWAFAANLTHTDTTVEYWIPITCLSRLLDWELHGLSAAGTHLMSVLIHALTSILLFYALMRLGLRTGLSLMVALVFALHPVQVEAICWASARKDLMGGLFWMLTLYAYGVYAARRGKWWYALLLAVFACALMAKPSVVTLPAILLLLDWWPLRRFRNERPLLLLLEKVPLAILSVTCIITSFLAQVDHGGLRTSAEYPPSLRVANAIGAYVDYVRSFLWPTGLSPLYPHPGGNLNWPWIAVCLLLLIAVSVLAWRRRREWGWLFTGWFWFLISLIPMIGLVQLGGAARADRYFYLPLTGLILIAVKGGSMILDRLRVSQRMQLLVGGVWICALGALAAMQAAHWRTSEGLFEYALSVTHRNRLAHMCLGSALAKRNDLDGAERNFLAAIALDETVPFGWTSLARVATWKHELAKALYCYQTAAKLDSNSAGAQFNLALALERSGQPDAAIETMTKAQQLQPEWGKPAVELARMRATSQRSANP